MTRYRFIMLCFALTASASAFLLLAPVRDPGDVDRGGAAPSAEAAAKQESVRGSGPQQAMPGGSGSHDPQVYSASFPGRGAESVEPDKLATNLDLPLAEAWLDFRRRYPGVDPTDEDQFYQAVLAERDALSDQLSPEQRDKHGEWLATAEAMRGEMIRERARLAGLQTEGITPEGRDFALTGFDGPEPIFTYSENHEAAITTAASFVRRNAAFNSVFGPDIDGSGFFANINDSGIIADHTEFRNDTDTAWRRTIIRGTDTGSGHGTHVSGTFGARGAESQAMGMAPAVHLYSFTQQNSADVLNYGMDWPGRPGRSIIGNTSLGTDRGDLNGLYTSTSASFDSALHDTAYYLHFYSIGNGGPGFITLNTTRKDAKNLFAVAAVSDVTRNDAGQRTGGGALRNSSAWGPTRDGRIKPDFAANGVSLFSSNITPEGVLGYSRRSGTSMAAPNAAGSALLLQDYFSKRFRGNLMRASTLMALILNTTEDLGNPGPDYKFGWGLMNILEAGRVIQRHADNPHARPIREERLIQGEPHTFAYQCAGDEPLRATLVWTDPPGPARTTSAETDPVLVNDLNLVAVSPGGISHHVFVMPYVIGSGALPPFHPDLFDAPATTGMNFTDNKIQVLVPEPEPGVWQIQVSYTGNLQGGSQVYSLVLAGLVSAKATAPPLIASHTAGGDPEQDFVLVEVQGGGLILGAELWFLRDGFAPVQAYAVEATSTSLRARLDHSSMAPGSWILAVRNPDGVQAISPQPYVVGEPSEMDPPTFANISMTADAHISLDLGGFGASEVQASTNLLALDAWITLVTNIAPFSFTDTNAVYLFPQRFYRIETPQME